MTCLDKHRLMKNRVASYAVGKPDISTVGGLRILSQCNCCRWHCHVGLLS